MSPLQPAAARPSRERRRLRNEIGVILVFKVAALALLFHFFFSGPARISVEPDRVARHLLPNDPLPSISPNQQ